MQFCCQVSDLRHSLNIVNSAAEEFFLELIKVPRVESKLRVFLFKMQFCSQVSDLRNSLNIINSAAEEVS
ncbi:hypothetical protein REPUB_Repub18cG0166400 [Reevesia pubescens]